MADNQTFKLKIITLDDVFYEGEGTFLEFTSIEGEMGVYAQHIPLTTILEPCVMTIYNEKEIKTAAVFGGFIEIRPDSIRVLVEDAQWPEDINVERAKEAEERAKKRLESGMDNLDVARAELALKRAMARLEVAGK